MSCQTQAAPRRFGTRELCYCALLVVLLAVCAWVSVPAPVPFTMQTFAVCLTLLLLGGRRGTLAISAYLLLGAAGAPVFSGFRGGMGVLLGATGGYLVGFLLTGGLYWALERFSRRRAWACAAVLALGLCVCYAFGTGWFMVVYAGTSGPIGLGGALGMCVLPFLLPDLAKLALALLLSRRLAPHISF